MKIAIYVTNDQTLGHITRISSLLSGLRHKLHDKVKILILHSGKLEHSMGLGKFGKLVNLPYSVDKKCFNFCRKVYLKTELIERVKGQHLLKKRQSIIKEQLASFKPDIFLTEYYPFGLEFWTFELTDIVKFLKANYNIKIACSIGYPSFAPQTPEAVKFYDRFFFHYPKIETDYYTSSLQKLSFKHQADNFKSSLRSCSKKICYTGYILDNKKISISKERLKKKIGIGKGQKLVIVSRGGGVINDRLILYSILAAKRLKDVFFMISTGPAISGTDFELFNRQCHGLKNIRLVKYLDNFMDYLNAADLSINMAGHNTVVKLLWLKKQSITVPLNSIEQIYRTQMLKDFNLTKGLEADSFNVDNLALSIYTMLKNPLKPTNKIERLSFNGIEETIKGLECLV